MKKLFNQFLCYLLYSAVLWNFMAVPMAYAQSGSPAPGRTVNYKVQGLGDSNLDKKHQADTQFGIDAAEVAETWITYVLTFLVSSLGLFLTLACRWKNVSTVLFALTGLTHIGSEIWAMMAYKNVAAEQLDIDLRRRREKGYITNHVTHLEALKNKVTEYRDVTEKKHKIMIAVTVGFAAAAAAALIETILSKVYPASQHEYAFLFKMECKMGDGKNDGISGGGTSASYEGPDLKKNSKVPFISALLNFFMGLKKSMQEWKDSPMSALIQDAIAQATPTATYFMGSPTPQMASDEIKDNPMLWVKIIFFAVPLVLAMIALIIAYKQGMVIKEGLALAFTRVVYFLFCSATAGLLIYLIDKKIKTLVARENYLAGIITALKQYNADNLLDTGLNLDSILPPPPPVTPGDESLLARGGGNICLTKMGTRYIIDRKCECKNKPGGCASGMLPTYPNQGMQFPPPVMGTMGGMQNTYNSLANGNMVGAQAYAGQVAGRYAAIKTLQKNLEDKFNKMLAKEGAPPVDFEAKAKALAAAQKAKLIRDLAAKGLTPSSFGASGGFSSDLFSPPTDLDQKIKKEGGGGDGKDGGGAAGGGGAGGDGKAEGPGLDFNLEDEGTGEEGAGDLAGALEEGGPTPDMKDYEDAYADISENKSEDIFKLVSRRYLMTAYPILLNEEDPVEGNPSPEAGE